MFSNLDMEFDYSKEAYELLEKFFEQEKENLIKAYESSLNFVKEIRKNYLDEKKSKLEQGKSIRINRKQQHEKWNKLKLTSFQRIVQMEMHPSQSEFLFEIVERYYISKIKAMYEKEGSPFNNKEAHEFYRQMPLSFSENDLSFLEYNYSSKPEYSLYINQHPYLVWMGKSQLIKRNEVGKPIWNKDKSDFIYNYTESYVVVQRFYNGFYWVVSSYEAIDTRQEKKRQAIDDFVAVLGQEEGAKSIEQISKELNEYMWLNPSEIQSLLSLAALRYLNRYNHQINDALKGPEFDKPRNKIAQQDFSNPLTLLIQYP
jgi:hypothetical protein